MAATATPALRGHRPALALVTTGVLGFLGITAVGGGAALIFGPGTAPGDSLQRIPLIDSWVVPGLVLRIGFGQLVWLALELVYLPDLSWLEALYTAVSVALLLLPVSVPVSRYLSR